MIKENNYQLFITRDYAAATKFNTNISFLADAIRWYPFCESFTVFKRNISKFLMFIFYFRHYLFLVTRLNNTACNDPGCCSQFDWVSRKLRNSRAIND